MTRERVLIRRSDDAHGKLVGPDDLEALEEALEIYGPETMGFLVDVEAGFDEDLPRGWTAEQLDVDDEPVDELVDDTEDLAALESERELGDGGEDG